MPEPTKTPTQAPAKPETVTITLLGDHVYNGKIYTRGQVVVDQATADVLRKSDESYGAPKGGMANDSDKLLKQLAAKETELANVRRDLATAQAKIKAVEADLAKKNEPAKGDPAK